MGNPHVLLVVFPTQGHINPALQFAHRLVRLGLQVTFATSKSATKRISNEVPLQGLSYATFSDGHDDGFNVDGDVKLFMEEIAEFGSRNLRKLIDEYIERGCRFTCVVYSVLIPWVAKTAREFQIPSMLLWDQPATVMDIYYYYTKGFRNVLLDCVKDPSGVVELPNLPPFSSSDLPSFFIPGNPNLFMLEGFAEHFKILDEETNPKILVNTFNALEFEALSAIKEYKVVGIGPLIPPTFLDEKEQINNSDNGDMLKPSKPYLDWLDTKLESSVIYIAFGSMSELKMAEMEEMSEALLEIGRPFLWRTNAKLLQDVWKVGVKVNKNADGTSHGDEIRRCLELVMESEEMRRNAKKWKELAREATREGGTSDKNLRDFADVVKQIGGY
ncbi:hypothetical protein ACFE04_014161 [Oxalis oulophora]